jgi:hypothetical protein
LRLSVKRLQNGMIAAAAGISAKARRNPQVFTKKILGARAFFCYKGSIKIKKIGKRP